MTNKRITALQRIHEIKNEIGVLRAEMKTIGDLHEPFTKEEEETVSALVERNWQAMGLYYELSDGYVWDAEGKLVRFETKTSADKFKAAFPEFTVTHIQYR